MAKHAFDPFNPDPDKRTFDPDNPVGIGLVCPSPDCAHVATGETKLVAEIDLAFHLNAEHPRSVTKYVREYNIENVPDTLQDENGKAITE